MHSVKKTYDSESENLMSFEECDTGLSNIAQADIQTDYTHFQHEDDPVESFLGFHRPESPIDVTPENDLMGFDEVEDNVWPCSGLSYDSKVICISCEFTQSVTSKYFCHRHQLAYTCRTRIVCPLLSWWME